MNGTLRLSLVICALFSSAAFACIEGSDTMLDESIVGVDEESVIGGGIFTDTDCGPGAGGCVAGTPPALILCPPTIGVGGYCGQGWCSGGQANMVCAAVWGPGVACAVLPAGNCPRSQTICQSTGACGASASGPDPSCGTSTRCEW
jgi:hypothetical protein